MTFYWWSHWFWITLLSNLLISITIVSTYPSQEISLEYNQNSRPYKTVTTKLYQTATTLTWATAAPAPPIAAAELAKTLIESVTTEIQAGDAETSQVEEHLKGEEVEYDNVEDDEQNEDQVELDEASEVDNNNNNNSDDVQASAEYEFKRSAENYNKSNEHATESGDKAANKTDSNTAGTVKEAVNNNYTNFTSTAHAKSSTNSSHESNTNSAKTESVVEAANATTSSTTTTTTTTTVASTAPGAPATPKIDNSLTTAVEWLNSMAQPPTLQVTGSDSAPQRVPFTLENANKEEELRRAENEHRSRKSKVLSAEYKHINRFINYSTDSKSLLARSASAPPNEYEADESNISSEALAIQRTYFLDASAISAICFTVFGFCCTVATIGLVLYRRRFLNKPQALSEPDSSVYIDDSTLRVSDNSDEMYSLDNDSFLNSLEAMTIQNYWTDTVKHTKL